MIGSIEGIVTIFDLGCGSGEMLKRLSQLGKGADLIGIDSSEVTIDYASQKLGESAYLIHRDINDVPDIRGKRF
ncbi:class I SAM-dependent methyltransferase [uncultured Corynebacterium sp.]|uniref:class I SAM-dependent methyltransferase n=1 Tax=uncultured Corynebacterium sp. TaxID=159447 RepID=UPI003459E1EC